MKQIKQKYKEKCDVESDINELLPILHRYARECEHITEMGVREAVSTWAFLAASPKKFICYDINHHPNIDEAKKIALKNNIDFEFKLESTLKCEIEETDLLFIDTWHSYNQLFSELNRHGSKARKYIIMHDTSDCEFRNENFVQEQINGLYPAIINFTLMNREWFIHEKFANNNGLTILKRKNEN
jgi:hypothetical protein